MSLDIESLWSAVPCIVSSPDDLSFIHQLPDKLVRIGAWSKRMAECRETYFLLYTAPLIEFSHLNQSQPDVTALPSWSSLMTAHMMLSLYLRVMDNVIDGDAQGLAMMSAVRIAEILLTEAISDVTSCGYSWTHEAQGLFNKWIGYEESIRKGRELAFDDLWERASTFLVIPQLYLKMREFELQMYKKYLSLLMLVHDMHDIFDDMRAARRTIPTEMLKSMGTPLHFKPATINPVMRDLGLIIDRHLSDLLNFSRANGLRYYSILLECVSREF